MPMQMRTSTKADCVADSWLNKDMTGRRCLLQDNGRGPCNVSTTGSLPLVMSCTVISHHDADD